MNTGGRDGGKEKSEAEEEEEEEEEGAYVCTVLTLV